MKGSLGSVSINVPTVWEIMAGKASLENKPKSYQVLQNVRDSIQQINSRIFSKNEHYFYVLSYGNMIRSTQFAS